MVRGHGSLLLRHVAVCAHDARCQHAREHEIGALCDGSDTILLLRLNRYIAYASADASFSSRTDRIVSSEHTD